MEDNEKHNGFKIFDDDDPEGSSPAEEEQADEILLTDDGMVARDGLSPGSSTVSTAQPTSAGRGLRGIFYFILLLALAGLGGGGYFAWDHVNQRLDRIERAGVHEVADLSREIDERMSVFSTQFATQHAEMQVQLSALRERIEESAGERNNLREEMAGARESHSDRIDDLENRMSGLQQRFDAEREEATETLRTLESRVESISDAMAEVAGDTAGMASAVGDMRADLEAMDLRIDAVSEQADEAAENDTGREAMARVEALQQEMDRRFGETNELMEQQLADLEDEIAALEAMMKSLRDLAAGGNDSSGIIEQELR